MKSKLGVLLMTTFLLNQVEAAPATIAAVLNDYFEGYQKADVGLIKKAFHQDTRILSVDQRALNKTEMADWLTSLADRAKKGDIRTGQLTVLSVDETGDTAMAKLRILFPKFEFTDYLSLLRIQGEWKIVGKIYHYREL
jgi:hypothetical protein